MMVHTKLKTAINALDGMITNFILFAFGGAVYISTMWIFSYTNIPYTTTNIAFTYIIAIGAGYFYVKACIYALAFHWIVLVETVKFIGRKWTSWNNQHE